MNRFDLIKGVKSSPKALAKPAPTKTSSAGRGMSPMSPDWTASATRVAEEMAEVGRRQARVRETDTGVLRTFTRGSIERNVAYSPESINYEFLRQLRPKSTLRTTLSNGLIVFHSVAANRPEERRIILRYRVNETRVAEEWQHELRAWDQWRTYEEVHEQFFRGVERFYYVGVKRTWWQRFCEEWGRMYD